MKLIVFHYSVLVHKSVASFAPPKFGETRSNENEKQIRHPPTTQVPSSICQVPSWKNIGTLHTDKTWNKKHPREKYFSRRYCVTMKWPSGIDLLHGHHFVNGNSSWKLQGGGIRQNIFNTFQKLLKFDKNCIVHSTFYLLNFNIVKSWDVNMLIYIYMCITKFSVFKGEFRGSAPGARPPKIFSNTIFFLTILHKGA